MTDDENNLILRLLREIRGKLDDHDNAFEGLNVRLTGLDRRLADVHESVGANAAYETTGQRLDRLSEEMRRLEVRLEKLEGSE